MKELYNSVHPEMRKFVQVQGRRKF